MRPSDIERHRPPIRDDARVGPARDATLLAEWPGVHVEEIEIQPPADGGLRIVRACVHLGALLPADVHVELLCAEDRLIEGEPPHSSRHEMWSVQSYDNGTFSYEGHVPAPALEGKLGCAVRVTSTATNVDPAEVPPVIRWLAPHDTGHEVRPDHLLGGRSATRHREQELPRRRA